MKIILLGKNGQVGWELQRSLGPLGQVIAHDRSTADLEQSDSLRKLVRDVEPDFLVNAAAYTAVDRAESEPERAARVNTEAVAVLAEEMQRNGGWFVHYSTDYVFDGAKSAPYIESDIPAPLSVYGKTKLAGERAILASGCRHLIFRTSWVYSARGSNFPKTMLHLAQTRDEIKVVGDQFGAPTGADLIADVTALALHRLQIDSRLARNASGVYHLAAAGSTSRHAYAKVVIGSVKAGGVSLRTQPEHVLPIPLSEYSTFAPRPSNSQLDCSRLCTTFGLTMPSWERGVQRLVAQLNESVKP